MVKPPWWKRALRLSDPYLPNQGTLAPSTRPDYAKNPVNPNTGMQPFARTPFPSAAGAVASSPAGVTVGDAPESDQTAFDAGIKAQTAATGNSGTQIFGGYFSEEYLSELRGRVGAKKWDEMRRSEAQIAMLLSAISNPIKAANWSVEAHDQNDLQSVLDAELIQMCLFEMIAFETFKHEALTVIPFGFALFEPIHSVVFNHPKFGTFNGLRALSYRSQKTIENWILEPKTGRLLGVNQYTYSDLGGNNFIPGEFCLVITNQKEGDNYEGISAMRSMVGAYKRKELYLKLAAIGLERYAIGTPIGTVPKGKEKTTEFDEFQKVLQNYTSHESSYIIVPEGWKIEIQKGEFDASKVKEMLVFENTEFANAVVGNFLALGMNGGGGAYALGSNLGEFFTTGIQSYADLICDAINRELIPNLIKLNYGERKGYPKLKVTGISDKAGKELAEVIKFLVDARALDPDMKLKEFLRKQYKLPKPDLSTAVPLPAIPAGASANYPKKSDPVVDPSTGKLIPYSPSQLDATPETFKEQSAEMTEEFRTIRLAESKYSKRFDANKAELKAFMQTQLTDMYAELRDQLKTRYRKLKGSDKKLAAKGLSLPGLAWYKAGLRGLLSKYAAETLGEAKRQVPKRLKLADVDYAALAQEYLASLSPDVRKFIETQAALIAETQGGDIEKIVFFQFVAKAASSDDIEAILNDVDDKVVPTIEGSTAEGMSVDVAAGDALAHVNQQATRDFFLSPDVIEGIESFTFTNEDPVSEICQSMVGVTVAPGDSILDEYATPLHHNCKSRWVTNFKGDSTNPEIGSGDAQENGGLSLTKKALASITLADDVTPWRLK